MEALFSLRQEAYPTRVFPYHPELYIHISLSVGVCLKYLKWMRRFLQIFISVYHFKIFLAVYQMIF